MIRPVGGCLAVDAEGFLVPDVAHEKIQPQWRCLLQDALAVIGAAPAWRGASVYLRGSVPRGLAVDGVSDIDLIVVADESADMAAATRGLLARHSFCRGIEWGHHRPEEAAKIHPPHRLPYLKVMLKTQGLHVGGPDILQDFPRIRPGFDMLCHAPGLAGDWQDYKDNDRCAAEDEERLWICKRILRAALEIAALDSPVFTRDLYHCCEVAGQAFPQLHQGLRQILSLALAEKSGRAEVVAAGQPVVDALAAMVAAHPLLCAKAVA